MSYTSYRLGPTATPKAIKILILTTVITNLLAALLDNIFPHLLGWLSPVQILALSAGGIKHFFLWQFVTYLFVSPLTQGITFSFLLSLAFNTYLLWVIGTALYEKKGAVHFFALYFASGITAGLAVFGLQYLVGTPSLFAGNLTALYATLVAWATLFPNAQLLLFLAFPLRARTLIFGILIINLLIDISVGNWLTAVAYTVSAFFGLFYGLLLSLELTPSSPASHFRAKIYDFRTGKAIQRDEEFLEEMLSKIARYGKESLTWRERIRLRRISKRRKR